MKLNFPGTGAGFTYDRQANAVYVYFRQKLPREELVTRTILSRPLVNVDYVDGQAIGIEVLLPSDDE